jgi:hypothetical protein
MCCPRLFCRVITVSVTFALQDFPRGSLVFLSLVFSKTLLQGHYCVSHFCCTRLFYRVITASVTCLFTTLLQGYYCTVSVTCVFPDSSTGSLQLLSRVCPQLSYRVVTVSVTRVFQDFSKGYYCVSLLLSKTLLLGHYCVCHLLRLLCCMYGQSAEWAALVQ